VPRTTGEGVASSRMGDVSPHRCQCPDALHRSACSAGLRCEIQRTCSGYPCAASLTMHVHSNAIASTTQIRPRAHRSLAFGRGRWAAAREASTEGEADLVVRAGCGGAVAHVLERGRGREMLFVLPLERRERPHGRRRRRSSGLRQRHHGCRSHPAHSARRKLRKLRGRVHDKGVAPPAAHYRLVAGPCAALSLYAAFLRLRSGANSLNAECFLHSHIR
jgi:hypothetical protein